MAKKSRPVKRKGAALTGRARGASGRLLASEEAQAAAAEVRQRLHDALFMPDDLKEARQKRDFRFREIAREQTERRKRYTTLPDAYKWAPKANNEYAIKASRLAKRGILPAPTEIRRFDDGTLEYIWSFQGPHGLDAINNMLVHSRDSFPKDAAGYISQGTGHGKDAQWGGTAFTPVWPTVEGEKTLWWQLQTFKISTTDSLKHLREHFGHKQENGRFPTQWVELKILSSEGMKYENIAENGSASNGGELDEGTAAPSPKRKRRPAGGKRRKGSNASRKRTKRKSKRKSRSKKLPRG